MRRNKTKVVYKDTPKLKTITVNELAHILEKHFHSRRIFITGIEYANMNDQWAVKELEIGVGGVLNITFISSRSLK